MIVWYIYQGMVELKTFFFSFIDASLKLDVLFMFFVEILYPMRGALYANLRSYSVGPSKYHDFLAISALAHSKINQIA